MDRVDTHFTTKITQHSNVGTHKTEEILEGDILPHSVLGVDGCHDDAGERAVIPRRALYSSLVGITFFHFDHVQK